MSSHFSASMTGAYKISSSPGQSTQPGVDARNPCPPSSPPTKWAPRQTLAPPRNPKHLPTLKN